MRNKFLFFGDTIRGGQVVLHRIRMLQQVASKSIKFSLIFAVLATSLHVNFWKKHQLKEISFDQLLKHCYIYLDRRLNSLVGSFQKAMSLKIKPEKSRVVLNDQHLRANLVKALNLMGSEFRIFFYFFGSGLIFVFIFWSKVGFLDKKETGDSGFLTPQEVKNYLRKNNLASWLSIEDMPLVKNSETQHILLTGATGTGKTNMFNILVPQIARKRQKAIIIDQTGEMLDRYYDAGRGDIIFNPFDDRSLSWDLFSEINNEGLLDSLATTMFSPNFKSDSFWQESAKCLFVDAFNKLENPSPLKLYDFFATSTLAKIREHLEGTLSAKFLDPSNDKTGMSILSTVLSGISWLKLLKEQKETFTIKKFLEHEENWLFVVASPSTRSSMKPLQTILLDLATVQLMDLGVNRDRRLWILIDELASLGKLTALPRAISELRKYGGCVVSGVQSINQLSTIYGNYEAKTLFSQFSTQIYFRMKDPELAKLISNMFGQITYRKTQESISYGSHEMRDGVQIGEQEKIRPLLEVSDLINLANLECFVSLPDPKVSLVKMKISYRG